MDRMTEQGRCFRRFRWQWLAATASVATLLAACGDSDGGAAATATTADDPTAAVDGPAAVDGSAAANEAGPRPKALASHYTATLVPLPAPLAAGQPLLVNDAGQVAGSVDTGAGQLQPFTWTKTAGLVTPVPAGIVVDQNRGGQVLVRENALPTLGRPGAGPRPRGPFS